MNNPTDKQPEVYPSESPAAWAKIRKAAEGGDEKKLRDLLTEADLSPKLAKLFIAAVDEEKELAAVIAAAEGQENKLRQLQDRIRLLATAHPATLAEVEIIAKENADLSKQAILAEQTLNSAGRAGRGVAWLRTWLAPLFGLPEPPHAGHLSALQVAPKTAEAAAALNIGGLYEVSGWRTLDEKAADEKPRRRYVAFSATPARH